MNGACNTESKDFFSKLWKSPLRRSWRYGRRFLLVLVLSVVLWAGLDFMAVAVMQPQSQMPVNAVLTHATLTIILSMILALGTHYLSVRQNSRFRLIRVFQPSRKNSHNR